MMVPSWVWGSGGALIASAAVRALPAPVPMGNRFYLWAYNFTHALLANFDKLGSPSAPSVVQSGAVPMTKEQAAGR